MENLKMGSKSLWLMLKNIHDSHGTVSNSFGPYLRDLLLKIWEIYEKCSNSVNFWARKMFFFFKWVRISPEIDWYHYQGASPAPTCIVRHQTMIKAPTSKVSHQSPVCPPCCELLCPTAVRLSIHPCCAFIRPPLAVRFSVLPPLCKSLIPIGLDW